MIAALLNSFQIGDEPQGSVFGHTVFADKLAEPDQLAVDPPVPRPDSPRRAEASSRGPAPPWTDGQAGCAGRSACPVSSARNWAWSLGVGAGGAGPPVGGGGPESRPLWHPSTAGRAPSTPVIGQHAESNNATPLNRGDDQLLAVTGPDSPIVGGRRMHAKAATAVAEQRASGGRAGDPRP
jgi:hypothetical protein